MSALVQVVQFVERVVTHNLLPALVAGAVAWLVVMAGVRLLDIRHGRLRLCLFLAPPIKSTLVLLGLMPVLPWPRDIFREWAAGAVNAEIMVPLFFVATGASFLLHGWTASRERRKALREGVPANQRAPRLAAAFDRVVGRFARGEAGLTKSCGGAPSLPPPRLLVTRRDLSSPLVVVEEDPTIVFPEALVERLDDRQLEGVLAHEMAHLHIRRRLSCTSAELARRLTAVNPFALAMTSQLELEEEKACDDVAVAVTGDRTGYAEMLLACYRHAAGGNRAAPPATVPQLLGIRPALVQRIERQMSEPAPVDDLPRQRVALGLLWCVLVLILFTG